MLFVSDPRLRKVYVVECLCVLILSNCWIPKSFELPPNLRKNEPLLKFGTLKVELN